MILRVPDYYEEFQCVADKCKDSCCIGWEINIDADTHDYYCNTRGTIGDRLRENMYVSADGEYSFRLKEHGRCPFLNAKNLCDICIEMGEESLSEVCTEYPRFTLDYGNVFQKCLSLSCEEVGRILFSRETPVAFVEREQLQIANYGNNDEIDEENEEGYDLFLEEAQKRLIQILQKRSLSIWEREKLYLSYARKLQQVVSEHGENEPFTLEQLPEMMDMAQAMEHEEWLSQSIDSYPIFDERFQLFEQIEELDREWGDTKAEVRAHLKQDTYEEVLKNYLFSKDYRETDYEQLLVYFTFRYFMQTYYDYNLLAKAKMAMTFTRVIRDIDAVRFNKNDGFFAREDRIDTARIFSKEVEHSEENVIFLEEELEFSD